MIDSMSPLDAAFLYAEDGVSHMHIGSCAIFEGPAPLFSELSALIESKLHALPRYRQKVRFVPAGLGHPVWVDDPRFHLSYHLRHSALPPPGTNSELEHLMGRLMSWELDRDRPLWEAWMVEGLADDRWALISKVHHCMVDGIAGTDLMISMLDRDRVAPLAETKPWMPEPEPSGTQLALHGLTQMMSRSLRPLGALGAAITEPRNTLARAVELGTALRSMASLLLMSRPVGIHRRLSGCASPLGGGAFIVGRDQSHPQGIWRERQRRGAGSRDWCISIAITRAR